MNKSIRETISSLSDEDLVNMKKASPGDYTPFARKVLEEELSRRRLMKSRIKGSRRVSDADPGALRETSDRASRSECHIDVWTDKNFEGEHLRIEGPVECQSLEFASLKWGDSISSLRVGPKAFVLVYAEKEFKGAMMSFGPGQEVSNLEELNFNDEIDSIIMVNSIRVFEESRAEDESEPAVVQERKVSKETRRDKIRGG